MPGDRGPAPVDDRHTAAGEHRWTNWQGWLMPVGAAATVLAAGALVSGTHRTPPAPVPVNVAVRPAVDPAEPAELIVRDGDLVEASGWVEEGSTMCSPAPVLTIHAPCQYGIRVPGIAPTNGATLRGRWHPGRLSDIRRMPYAPTSAGVLGDSDLPDTPPCPAPPGGWRDGEDYVDEQVRDHLRAHADQFAEPFATHLGNARILVVEVVSGDVDRARAALTAIYTDNLCVVAAPGGHSIAAEDRLQATTGRALGALLDEAGRSDVYLAGSDNGRIRVMMIQLTQPLYDKLAAIGLDHLILDPWIRPVDP